MPLTSGTRFGHYEIVGPLGAGGMGEVYEIVDAALVADIMERTDVGMGELGNGPGLAVEARFAIRILGEMRREDLDRNDAAEPRVAGLVNLAHASGAQQAEDLEWPEARAGGETHDALEATCTSMLSVAVESDGSRPYSRKTNTVGPIMMWSPPSEIHRSLHGDRTLVSQAVTESAASGLRTRLARRSCRASSGTRISTPSTGTHGRPSRNRS
jgi:hypothetical protein